MSKPITVIEPVPANGAARTAAPETCGEPILVVQEVYKKGREAFFNAALPGPVLPVPSGEADLARCVRKSGARAVILGIQRYEGALYESFKEGGLLARFGVGVDGLDLARARDRGIVVTNTPGVLENSVAELVLWLMGCLARRIPQHQESWRRGCPSTPESGVELHGKRLGLIGFGRIARRVARAASLGLGMSVNAFGRHSLEELSAASAMDPQSWLEAQHIASYTQDIRELLPRCDFISCHLPLDSATAGFCDRQFFDHCKPGAYFINTSRAELVNEDDLLAALAAERLRAAALDVSSAEHGPGLKSPLRDDARILHTPHIGSNTAEANRRMAERALHNVRCFLAGRLDDLDCVRVSAASGAPLHRHEELVAAVPRSWPTL